MSRIGKTFKRLKGKGEKALIAYIMAGDPSLEITEEILYALEDGGADIVELGIPFSDPLADGPVIQRAAERALASSTNLCGVLKMVSNIRKRSNLPIVVMTYYNIIAKYGEEDFFEDASKSGIDGVIIPDLPPEEGENAIREAKKNGIDTIFLLSPTSNDKRISLISKKSEGFIYYVSLTGVTGVRTVLSESIAPMIQKIRSVTKKPVAVGFGISNAEQAAQVSKYSDGVVIGSAIVKIIEENGSKGNVTQLVKDFAKELKSGMNN